MVGCSAVLRRAAVVLVSAVALVAGLLVGLPPAAHAGPSRSAGRTLTAVKMSAKRALVRVCQEFCVSGLA
jgi:hypothetical protein